MKRPDSRKANWIPSNYSGKPVSSAARVRSRCDVVKTSQCEAVAVQPGVEPAKRGLILRKQMIIQLRDDASHGLYVGCQPNELEAKQREEVKMHRCRATCTRKGKEVTVYNDPNINCLRGNVRNAAASGAAQITR